MQITIPEKSKRKTSQNRTEQKRKKKTRISQSKILENRQLWTNTSMFLKGKET